MPLEGLSQSEQLSVFLNLYHVMLLHAFFILGPPGSPLRYGAVMRCNRVWCGAVRYNAVQSGVVRCGAIGANNRVWQFLSGRF